MKFLFYADKGEQVGLGHMRRSEALSFEFKQRGWQVDRSPGRMESYDGIVIDSYTLTPGQIREYKKLCPFLIGFHDMGEPNMDFSLLVSSAYPTNVIEGKTRILGGHAYKPIHLDIKATPTATIRETVSLAVVTFGGRDVVADLPQKAIETLATRFPDIRFQIVAGKGSKEAAALFSSADIAICGGGQTMCELLYLGVPTVVVELSEDQKRQIAEATESEAVRTAGAVTEPSIFDNIAENVASLYSKLARMALNKAGKAFIDGRGAERIAGEIAKLIS